MRNTARGAALLLTGLAAAAAAGADAPFAYPASLLEARSTFTVSPAAPVMLGATSVVLEQSRLSDVAAVAHAPVRTEGKGPGARSLACVQSRTESGPVMLWFIATAGPTVTEVQMEPGTFSRPKDCGILPAHFEPVSVSRISLGQKLADVVQDIGPVSHSDPEGWNFWVSRVRFVYDGRSYTQFTWVGAQADGEGTVRRVFTSQLTL